MRLTHVKEEQQWQELKKHLEWAELFSLIVLFVDDESLVDIFRTRLYHQQKGHVSALKILKPVNTDTLTRDFFSLLEKQIIPDVKVPLWLELYQRGESWDLARDVFFLGLMSTVISLERNFLIRLLFLFLLLTKVVYAILRLIFGLLEIIQMSC